MTPLTWPCPQAAGRVSEQYALAFDGGRPRCVLIAPALFDEANRLRRLTVEVMRRLDAAGIDSVLPDLPGCNESTLELPRQGPDDWRDAMEVAARHFGSTHCLALRGGCLVAPASLPGWHYAPISGAAILRQMLRTRIVAAREAGLTETRDGLMEMALTDGIDLAGHSLSADFVRQFQSLEPQPGAHVATIDQDMVGGSGLWLRAEPGESPDQADALAAIIAIGLGQ